MKRLFVCVCLLLASCAKNPVSGDYDFVILNEQQEYKNAKKYRASIANSKVYKNKQLQFYLQNLAEEVYQVGERPDKPFSFYFLNDDDANAFAIPGYVFMSRGLIPYIQDEASLMGVLGHEAAHINARHSVQDYSNAFLINWLLNSLNATGSVAFTKSQIDKIDELANLSYSRSQEYEADSLAVKYLDDLNVPSANFLQTFKSLGQKEELDRKTKNLNKYLTSEIKPEATYLRTHPHGKDRAEKIKKITDAWYKDIEYYNQDRFYQMIDGLEYGYASSGGGSDYVVNYAKQTVFQSPKSGVYGFKNTAYFKTYGIKMLMPADYQARIKAQDPVGYNYQDDIKVSVLETDVDKADSLLDVFANMISLDESEKEDLSQELKKQKSVFSTNYNNLTNSLDLNEELFYYVDSANILSRLLGKNSVYYYIYIKQVNKFEENGQHNDIFDRYRVVVLSSKYKKSFDESMLNDILFIKDNLVELDDTQKAKIKPLKIKTIKTDKTLSIQELAKEYTPYIHYDQEWFKLINGIFNANDTISPDRWLKLIPNPNKDV